MYKLLAANLRRLWRNSYLWITCISCLGLSIFNSLDSNRSFLLRSEQGYEHFAEGFFYGMVATLGLFLGAFVSLFLGTEHSDGTIRNKLTVGKTRNSVYLANFFTCFISSFLLLISWFIGAIVFLIISDAPLEHGYTGIAESMLQLVGIMAVFSAIYTMIGSLCTNKALMVVFSFLVFLVLMVPASGLYDRLGSPEFTGGMTMIDGQLVDMGKIPNPLYLSGTIRELCQIALELLPTGQSILIVYVDVIHPIRQLCFSLVLTIAILLLGMACFQKKDLK